MKKIRFLLSAVLVAACCFTVSLAEYGISDWPALQQKQAQFLLELGLFRGTDKGFELDKTMTRAEAAVMLTRLLGAEKEVLEKNYKSPFKDVSDWAAPYVGWLYKNKLTNGTGNGTYSPDTVINCDQYATFMLRVCGVDSSAVLSPSDKTNFYPQSSQKRWNTPLTRGDAVEVAILTLETKVTNGTESLAQKLIRTNVITEEKLLSVAPIIYQPDRLHSKLMPEIEVCDLTHTEDGKSSRFFQVGNVLYKRTSTGNLAIDSTADFRENAWSFLHSTDIADYFFRKIDDFDKYEIVKYDVTHKDTKAIYTPIFIGDEHIASFGNRRIVYKGTLYWCSNRQLFALNFTNDRVWQREPKEIICGISAIDNGIFLMTSAGVIEKLNEDLTTQTVLFQKQEHTIDGGNMFFLSQNVLSYNGNTLVFQDAQSEGSDIAGKLRHYVLYTFTHNIKANTLTCDSAAVQKYVPDYWDTSFKPQNTVEFEKEFQDCYAIDTWSYARAKLNSMQQALLDYYR